LWKWLKKSNFPFSECTSSLNLARSPAKRWTCAGEVSRPSTLEDQTLAVCVTLPKSREPKWKSWYTTVKLEAEAETGKAYYAKVEPGKSETFRAVFEVGQVDAATACNDLRIGEGGEGRVHQTERHRHECVTRKIEEKEKMKSIFSVTLALFLAIPADAGKVEGRGREWLDEHKDSPQVNVAGSWQSPDWGGTLTLTQAEGSRDVSGNDKRFELTGTVSGKEVYLLFAHSNGSVAFCATLVSASDGVLTGTYSYPVSRLKLGHGLCQTKSYRLRMTKSSAAPAPHK
jgi:hypothetical protein